VGDLHIIFNVVFPTHDDIAKSDEKKKVRLRAKTVYRSVSP
jgi:hypothetical protein